MKKETLFQTMSILVIVALPFMYLAFVWDALPAQFVLNSSKSDRLVSKQQLFEPLIMMAILGIGLYFIVKNVKYQGVKLSPKLTNKLGFLSVAFCSSMSIYTIYTVIHPEADNFLFVLIGLFFTFSGNFMHSLKPNHAVGFRLPWLFKNEEIWRKTHQLGSKIWFFGGLFIAIAALSFPENWLIVVFMGSMFIMCLIPIVYSYRLYKKSV